MNDDLRSLYLLVLLYEWKPKLIKIYNGLYHIYLDRGKGGMDGVPCVLKEKGISYKSCSCCKWKPD